MTASTAQAARIDPQTLKAWLHDGQEIALLDVREHGQFGESHLFYAVPLPYSRLEIEARRLVPRLATRIVLHDEGDVQGGDSVAERAAAALRRLGYSAVHVLAGGIAAWRAAGYACFAGVNVPSKTFGELAELAFHTPRISARELADRVARGDKLVILDGRPLTEFAKMSIPGGTCCPNGELALRAETMVPDPSTTIVVNCAGRTRSIIGAQTLINVGVPNPVLALENGTQGWFLEGLALDHGASRHYPEAPAIADSRAQSEKALALARRFGVRFIDDAQLQDWLADAQRSTFLCDVRTAEEFARGTLPQARHAPGGQLLQATDQYVGVRKARIVVFDGEMVRAPVIASWLVQMGWDASVLRTTAAALTSTPRNANANADDGDAEHELTAPIIGARDAAPLLNADATVLDVRASAKYRAGHLRGARWSIRPLLNRIPLARDGQLLLVADDAQVAALAVDEVRRNTTGAPAISVLLDAPAAWQAAGLPMEATPDVPPDAECIDYLFFVHDRHDGNRAAALKYLEWETNLVRQIDAQERAEFRFD